ncbi:putative NADH-ubiquinone oxidoreductase subunit B17.2 [Protomyces lactucae-debilis]|uniref:NADH dehydrogenase [ubiquinone] 1 alpha subcomplex subunit n=1 Tax=Protomyces lactucae-debilis TaxID=2754530 RepID=A0A1Y2FAV6_PROLT|nr:putative NADH-ubiquinone oxidoreductase subunit B17.2 [Protomyces lactucae-debilis]ORY79995.1 putative NADH-ubiquinone oxidoreductase subunit B17.2 [Protomyces lactucae-debilis]
MSSITRTFRNLRKIGFRQAAHQMQHVGDTKAGRLVGIDKMGNKYYEDPTEVPFRNRWVDFADYTNEASQIEPGWYSWLAHTLNKAPSEDAALATEQYPWEIKWRKNPTGTFGAYKPYSTVREKINKWEPQVRSRS